MLTMDVSVGCRNRFEAGIVVSTLVVVFCYSFGLGRNFREWLFSVNLEKEKLCLYGG
jgi:hypothetical protein